MPLPDGYIGQQRQSTDDGGFNSITFLVQQMLNRVNTATLVKIAAVNTSGSRVAIVGTVDAIPLVNLTTGDDTGFPHSTIHGLPYLRLQGGTNAIICDPVVGDVGFCVFADHDISAVKASGAAANPASKRKFDFADGLYLGAWSKILPVNYLLLDATSALMKNQALIELDAPSINLVNAAAALKVGNTQVLTSQQTGVGATPIVYTLTGTYATDLANLQLAYNAIRLLMTKLKIHGMVAT